MEMRFKNEIKKLSDVVVWSDNAIKEMRMDFPDLPEEEFENLPAVKDFEDVKEAVNNAIKRHAVYTSALKNDFANKVAEVEKLTKEVEELKKKDEDRKDHIKELETEYVHVTKYNNVCQALTLRDEEIEKLKVDLIHEREKNEKLAKDHAKLENDMRYKTIIEYQDVIDDLNKEKDELKKEIERLNRYDKNLDKVNHDLVIRVTLLESEIESRKKESEKMRTCKNVEIGMLKEENDNLKAQNERLKKEIEGRKKAFNELMEEMANRYIAIETHDNICKDYEETRRELEAYWKNKCMKIQKKDQDKMNELEEDNKILHERIYSAEELHIKLSEENEKLKVEVTEALAKRDYYQDLANKEAADAKKAKQDCEKEIEWQKKKLREFDYVLTKYRAKIKELEDANAFFKLMINLIIKE